MFGAFTRQIRARLWGHLSDTTLFLFHDGELSHKRCVSVQAHLKRCSRCRQRADQIAQDWNSLTKLSLAATTDPLLEEEELIPKIRASIHAWSAANLPASQQKEIKASVGIKAEHQVAAVLEVYLGKRAVSALLHGGRMEEISNLEDLAQARSILRILMGLKGSTAIDKKLLKIVERLPDPSARF